MDQNQPVDNDLQKAIDDITNTTNIDPVFSDPVAAPSSIPEGDTGEIGEPVGPFPEPQPEIPAPASPEPTDTPDLGVPATPPLPPEPATIPAPAPAPIAEPPTIATTSQVSGLNQVKQAALRDLIPLVDHLNLTPTQKFNIYRSTFEDLKNYAVLEPAYHAAREIPDETERAEALLYLVESIDKM